MYVEIHSCTVTSRHAPCPCAPWVVCDFAAKPVIFRVFFVHFANKYGGVQQVADVCHLYAQHDVHLAWSERLEEEMWLQGDVEKQLSMKVSFLMDRDSPGVTKSQPGFFDFVVRPLLETWCACFPESNVLLERIEVNYQHWKLKESKAA